MGSVSPHSPIWAGERWGGSQAAVGPGGTPVHPPPRPRPAAPGSALPGRPGGRTPWPGLHHRDTARFWQGPAFESDAGQYVSLGGLRGGGAAQGQERSGQKLVHEPALLLLWLHRQPHGFPGIYKHLWRSGKSISISSCIVDSFHVFSFKKLSSKPVPFHALRRHVGSQQLGVVHPDEVPRSTIISSCLICHCS